MWLAFGCALLAFGYLSSNISLRIGSLAILSLTTAKVFLFDMGELSGIYRAVSFLGLGAILVGIGYLYQRFILPAAEPPKTPTSVP